VQARRPATGPAFCVSHLHRVFAVLKAWAACRRAVRAHGVSVSPRSQATTELLHAPRGDARRYPQGPADPSRYRGEKVGFATGFMILLVGYGMQRRRQRLREDRVQDRRGQRSGKRRLSRSFCAARPARHPSEARSGRTPDRLACRAWPSRMGGVLRVVNRSARIMAADCFNPLATGELRVWKQCGGRPG
jgi:hypothetical protein